MIDTRAIKSATAEDGAFRKPDSVRAPKTAVLVANQIRDRILKGELKDGDSLPPELQLAAAFGVSRPTFREAIRILENEKFLSVVRGSRSGATVHLPSIDGVATQAAFALQGIGAPIQHIYEARLAIEPFAIEALAHRRTDDDLAQLSRWVDDAESRVGEEARPQFAAKLAEFHQLIMRLHGNTALTLLSDLLMEIVRRHQSAVGSGDEETAAAYRQRVRFGLKSMRKLIDLLEARDAAGAAAHWRLHLTNASKAWITAYGKHPVIDMSSAAR